MADLITHMACGLVVKGATRGPYTAALVAGTVLPDLGARVPAMGFSALAKAGAAVPPEVPYAFEVLHMPSGAGRWRRARAAPAGSGDQRCAAQQ